MQLVFKCRLGRKGITKEISAVCTTQIGQVALNPDYALEAIFQILG